MIVASVQLKGGSGKTTTTLGVAIAALRAGLQSATVIDLDPQRSAESWIRRFSLPIDILTKLPRTYSPRQLYLIDTPGLDAQTTAEALQAADRLVVPLRASLLDFDAARRVVSAIVGLRKQAAWLPSQIDPRRAYDRNLVKSLSAAMQRDLPTWPILPAIRVLSGIDGYLRGLGLLTGTEDTRETKRAADDFAAVWTALLA